MTWNHSAMSTSGHWDQKLQWRSWPDTSLVFSRLDLLLIADAEWGLGREGCGQCIRNACFSPHGSDTNTSSLSKENHRGTHELASAVPTLSPATRWRKTSLYLTPLAGWQSRWGCENSPLMNTNLEEQLWILLHLANLFPRNGSFENFSDSVVAMHFRTPMLYLCSPRRVAQWAELYLALLSGFLKWEIEEEVTLMTFFLPEGSNDRKGICIVIITPLQVNPCAPAEKKSVEIISIMKFRSNSF